MSCCGGWARERSPLRRGTCRQRQRVQRRAQSPAHGDTAQADPARSSRRIHSVPPCRTIRPRSTQPSAGGAAQHPAGPDGQRAQTGDKTSVSSPASVRCSMACPSREPTVGPWTTCSSSCTPRRGPCSSRRPRSCTGPWLSSPRPHTRGPERPTVEGIVRCLGVGAAALVPGQSRRATGAAAAQRNARGCSFRRLVRQPTVTVVRLAVGQAGVLLLGAKHVQHLQELTSRDRSAQPARPPKCRKPCLPCRFSQHHVVCLLNCRRAVRRFHTASPASSTRTGITVIQRSERRTTFAAQMMVTTDRASGVVV